MNPKRVLDLLGRLAMLKYFPANNEAVLEGLLDLVSEMCSNEVQVEWLVKRMISGLYAEWPGPQEMRAVLCSRFRPKDGINAYSTVYLDGIPASREAILAIGPGDQKLLPLPEGKVASADERIEAGVHILAKANKLMNNLGGPATPEEIRTAPRWLRQLEGYE
jgi:hypothetical protein